MHLVDMDASFQQLRTITTQESHSSLPSQSASKTFPTKKNQHHYYFTMSQQESEVPKGAKEGWLDEESDNNVKYAVKAAEYDISKVSKEGNAPDASGPSFKDVSVYWTVGSSGAPSTDVQNRTSITWYKLEKAPWYSPYQYELTFNAKDTYHFYFTDEEPDTYGVNVFQNGGSHFVQYRSAKPTIVKITGN